MFEIIHTLVDEGKFLEVHKELPPTLSWDLPALRHFCGDCSQSAAVLAGVLDINASRKAAVLYVSAMHSTFPW
jgi:acetyl-CoA carboxylase carboxyltransferase component